MTRERHKQGTCEAKSIDVLYRGGQVCSSVEVIVMMMEQRNLATKAALNCQLRELFLGGTFWKQ
jgi:hypothetical protein